MKTILRLTGAMVIVAMIAGISVAQSVTNSGIVHTTTTAVTLGSTSGANASWQSTSEAPLASSAITYFDATAPAHSWTVASQWGTSLYLFGPAERITLPTDQGLLDSVKIVFEAIQGDSLYITIDPDTLFPTQQGDFHLVNIFGQNAQIINRVAIPAPNVQSEIALTLRYNKLPVPKQFHVVVNPRLVGTNFTSAFILKGDSEATRVRTPDNTHSSFIGINASNLSLVAGPVDSFFIPPGDVEPIFSNFAITAYVSTGGSGVATTTSEPNVTLYPNPTSNSLTVKEGAGEVNAIEIRDILGREALASDVTADRKVDLHTLPVGRYEAILHTKTGIVTMPILIQR